MATRVKARTSMTHTERQTAEREAFGDAADATLDQPVTKRRHARRQRQDDDSPHRSSTDDRVLVDGHETVIAAHNVVAQVGTARTLAEIDDLTLDAGNANAGTTRGRALLDASLREYGAGRSILVDREGRVIAGNKTVEQARAHALPIDVIQSNGTRLVVVQRTDLDLATDERARKLAIADNRVAELDLAWDTERLRQHLADGIDLSAFWTETEFEQVFGPPVRDGLGDPDAPASLRPTTIQPGDLFLLGQHRVLCGDATSSADVKRLLNGATPRLMATDPPYGVAYDPAWRIAVDGSAHHALGRVTNDDRVDWREAFALFPGDVAYVWHAGLHAGTVAEALQAEGFELRAQIIWRKQHFALSRGDYHWQHEPCWYGVRKGRSSGWLGDRAQSTVWDVPNLNPHGGDAGGANARTEHSTQKPVRLFERPLLHHTERGEAIYEPFAGSGSCLIAAEQTGRRCYAMECEPAYVQLVIDRWAAFTGEMPARAAS